MNFVKALCIGSAMALASTAAVAQSDFPSRTIEIVVPSGTGGGQDTMTRLIQPMLEKELGVSIRVSNVPGGGHSKGIMYSNNAPADGYLVHCLSGSDLIADIFKKMPFNFTEAFEPLVRMQKDNGLFWTGKNGRFKTVQEMIAFAKENPGKVTVTISSPGGGDDAAVGHFANLAGIKIAVVPIDSGGERMASIIAGHVDMMYEEASAVGDMMKSGEIVPLVVFADKRLPTDELKDVPSAGELGLKGWDGIGTFRGFAVKKGTPKEAKDKLLAAFKAAYDNPKYQEWAAQNALTLTPGWMGPDEFGKLWDTMMPRYTEIFKELGRIK